MERVFKSHIVKDGLSSPENRTRAMGYKWHSVRFWLIKSKSCPTNATNVDVSPMANEDKCVWWTHSPKNPIEMSTTEDWMQTPLESFSICICVQVTTWALMHVIMKLTISALSPPKRNISSALWSTSVFKCTWV